MKPSIEPGSVVPVAAACLAALTVAPTASYPSPSFRAEKEGPVAERREGEVGLGRHSGIPTSPQPSPPPREQGGRRGSEPRLMNVLASRAEPAAHDFAASAVRHGRTAFIRASTAPQGTPSGVATT